MRNPGIGTAVALAVSLLVTITFRETQMVACVQPEPTVTRNLDGSYSRKQAPLRHQTFGWGATDCRIEKAWLEEWTDFPERGGTLIRSFRTLGEE